MKSKSKHAKFIKSHEFRYHNINIIKEGKIVKIRHPAYIFLKRGNLYIYVSLTHSDNVEGCLVIRLQKNPNPSDNRPSFYVVDIRTDTKDRFGRRENNWEMDLLDDEEIRKWFYGTKKDDSVDRE